MNETLTRTIELPADIPYGKLNDRKTKLVLSKAGYKETDDTVSYWRNGRFGILLIYFCKQTGTLRFVLRNSNNKTITWVRYEKERILMWDYKRGFMAGLRNTSYDVLVSLRKIFIVQKEEFDHIYEVFNKVETYFVDLFLKFHHYKCLTNVYFKFYNNSDSRLYGIYDTKSTFYKNFRKCRGINDVTKLIFGKNAKSYREFLLDNSNDTYCIYSNLYLFRKYLSMSPETLINIHKKRWTSFRHAPLKLKNLKQYIKVFGYRKLRSFITNLPNNSGDHLNQIEHTYNMRLLFSNVVNEYVDKLNLSIRKQHDLYSYLRRYLNSYAIYQLPFYDKLNNLPSHPEFTYVFPQTSVDLMKWGEQLRICIGYYDSQIIDGSCYCFSVVDNEGSRYCFEYSRGQITQSVGYRNEPAPENIVKIVKQDFKNLGGIRLKRHDAIQITDDTKKDDDAKLIQLTHDFLREERLTRQPQEQRNQIAQAVRVSVA